MTILNFILTVSLVSYLDTSIVSDIFSLSIDAIQIEIHLFSLIVAILVNNTLGPFLEVF